MDSLKSPPTPVAIAVRPLATPLVALGSLNAASCEGDFCVVPEHHTQAVVNRKVDEGLV
jgi:hypothetical protein